ncbi:DUF6281 family protein [Streptomyces justiciae]|uniref:DUF6281 family protein n=1 Tax=Streptomyces justiciae TaxID=2780140 RepID=A0ABU3M8D2_9ACTN|nr:DUF6281 family protein [Streptomyces justiciae]MDT7847787.1 DUF6281 family protein [Streptomyces justiciae]
MSWVGRHAIAAGLAAVAFTAVGCGSEGSEGAESSGESVCASDFSYEGRTYIKLSDVEFKVGQKVGTATSPACRDTNDRAAEVPESSENAYAVSGISPDVVIAIGSSPEEAEAFRVLRSDKKIPPEVQELINGS